MNEVAEQVVDLAEEYLGFAARNYLERQCRIHMDKELEYLRVSDLDELAKWVKNTGPLVSNSDVAEQLSNDILRMQKQLQEQD